MTPEKVRCARCGRIVAFILGEDVRLVQPCPYHPEEGWVIAEPPAE